MKTTLFLLFSILPTLVYAQSVSCKPHGEGHYKKLEIFKPNDNFNVPWFMARLDNQYNQRKNFTVIATSRGERVLLVSKEDSTAFSLEFADYKGPGVYHSVKLTLNQGSSKEETASLMCEQTGDLGLVNLCKAEKPNEILFQAAKSRDLDQLEAILDCGVDANTKDENGCTALLLAGDEACGQKTGTSLPYTPMKSALPIVDLLTNSGAMLEAKDPVTGEKALHKFAKHGDYDVVSLLLDLEADANSQDNDGNTALMRAVERNDFYLVQRFVEAGPDLKLKNKSGATAYDIAKNRELSKLLPLLQEPTSIIEVSGQADGTCSPQTIKIKANEVSKFTLKATEEDMFLLEASALGLSLMADTDSQVTKNIIPARKGTFEFTCGVHGAQVQTTGQIIVE